MGLSAIELKKKERNEELRSFLRTAGIVIPFVLLFGGLMMLGYRADQNRLLRDVAMGKRLSSGEEIVVDQGTGCEYIRAEISRGFFGNGYTLVPRLGQDGRPLGCSAK